MKVKNMWKVTGLEDALKNDVNLYGTFDQAYIHAPVPSFIEKVEVVVS